MDPQDLFEPKFVFIVNQILNSYENSQGVPVVFLQQYDIVYYFKKYEKTAMPLIDYLVLQKTKLIIQRSLYRSLTDEK